MVDFCMVNVGKCIIHWILLVRKVGSLDVFFFFFSGDVLLIFVHHFGRNVCSNHRSPNKLI